MSTYICKYNYMSTYIILLIWYIRGDMKPMLGEGETWCVAKLVRDTQQHVPTRLPQHRHTSRQRGNCVKSLCGKSLQPSFTGLSPQKEGCIFQQKNRMHIPENLSLG